MCVRSVIELVCQLAEITICDLKHEGCGIWRLDVVYHSQEKQFYGPSFDMIQYGIFNWKKTIDDKRKGSN